MNEEISPQDLAKIAAGKAAIEQFIFDGIKIGLGSGTTSHFFVRSLGEKVRDGLNVIATTTSRGTASVAAEAGIDILDINEIGELDLTIDGPDEIDDQFRMIKGGGACLLWEKIVAHSSKKMITICDETKLVDCLGAFPLPVEVVQFGWQRTEHMISQVLFDAGITEADIYQRRQNGAPVITDSGNYIIDCKCGRIEDPQYLETRLNMIPGVVENGLFTREAAGMIVGNFNQTTNTVMR